VRADPGPGSMNAGPGIRDPKREGQTVRNRLLVAGAGVLLLAGLLGMRLSHLQVNQHEHFSTLSEANHIQLVPVPPVRGLIYDRNGLLLAENFPVYTIEVVPDRVADMETLLDGIGQVVELRPRDMDLFRRQMRLRPAFETLTLRTNLSEDEASRFALNRYRFQGAELRARLQRRYPKAGLTGHVVGYVGRISETDVQRIDRARYRGTDYIGKLGVEAHYEDLLHGYPGFEEVEINAHGRVVRTLSRTAPKAGRNLYLALDARLQALAEVAMGEHNGAVVAIEPRTGAVLAFMSTPTYDPNPFVNGIDHQSYAELRKSDDRPLLNRALHGRYAPGSTIKSFLGLAILESGRSAEQTVFCPGWFSLPNSRHRYRDWRRQGHGHVNLHEAIVQSCDVYFYHQANQMGMDGMHDFLTRIGWGRVTGIDLGGEPTGLVPSREWKRRVRGEPWYPGETVIAGIGQGYMLTTPLQLAVSTATIANRGQPVTPRLVQGIEDVQTHHLARAEPLLDEPIVLRNERFYELVIDAMEDVLHGPRGTARGSGAGAEYRIAGKTGTSQVIGIPQGETYDEARVPKRFRDHALFVAFAPADDPRIAIAVIAENAGGGARSAAPVARRLLDFYLLGYDPVARAEEEAAAAAAAAGEEGRP